MQMIYTAPSRKAAMMMLKICEDFAAENNVKFLTHEKPARAEHHRHVLRDDGTLKKDCQKQLAIFIDSTVKIRESFGFAHPIDILFAYEKYCSSHYGCELWDLQSIQCKKYFSA